MIANTRNGTLIGFAATTLLAGCGGGGSSSSSDDFSAAAFDTQSTTEQSAPIRSLAQASEAPIAISTDNASELTGALIEMLEMFGGGASSSEVDVSQFEQFGQFEGFDLSRFSEIEFDDALALIEQGFGTENSEHSCPGGGSKMLTINDGQALPGEELTRIALSFINCQMTPLGINGSITINRSAIAEGDGSRIEIAADAFEVLIADKAIALDGDVFIQMSLSEGQMEAGGKVFVMADEDQSSRMSEWTLRSWRDDATNLCQMTASATAVGLHDEQFNGEVGFSTAEPLQFADCATLVSGVVLASGADNSSFRAEIQDGYATIRVDADGDGVFESEQEWSIEELQANR